MGANTIASKLFIVSVILGACTARLSAQDDTTRIRITGRVVDQMGAPVEGAEIRVVGGTAHTLTSTTGAFTIYSLRSRETLVQVRRPGYNAELLSITGDWNGTVVLSRGNFQLPEIQVTSRSAKPARYAGTTKYDDVFRRKRQGLGEFVGREEIERRPVMRAAEIFQARPGIKVSLRPPGSHGGTVVTFARCDEYPPRINVYVDGRKLLASFELHKDYVSPLMLKRPPRDPDVNGIVGEMLDRVNPSDIEMIEIFRGPGELPPEFNDDNCGAIAIWTRQGPGPDTAAVRPQPR